MFWKIFNMAIYFITGNSGKFNQAKAILPEIRQLKLDLPEIQSLDPHEIIKEKLKAARERHSGDFIVEDMSMSFSAFKGFPGPLVKWFFESLGNQGIFDVLSKLGDAKAEAK